MVIYQSQIYRVIAKLRGYGALEFCDKFDKLIRGKPLELALFNERVEQLVENYR